MMWYRIVQRLQNSPHTKWIWRFWQHKETGEICLLPIWNNPGKQWVMVGWLKKKTGE